MSLDQMPAHPIGSTILIVDDELPLLEVFSTALTDAGHVCLTASGANAALVLLDERQEIDLIISDIRMPKMDGLQLLELVRKRFVERTWLQVIFVTGHASVDTAVSALRLDAVDFLHKPVKRQALLAAAEQAIGRARMNRATLSAWNAGRSQMERLGDETRRLTELLAQLPIPGDVPALPSNAADTSDPVKRDASPTQERLLELLKAHDLRTRYFSDKLFLSPAWQMLLDLMENKLLDRRISVSSLYIASGAADSSASRKLEDLEARELVERYDDPEDKRRQFVQLTAKGVKLLTAYLHELDRRMQA